MSKTSQKYEAIAAKFRTAITELSDEQLNAHIDRLEKEYEATLADSNPDQGRIGAMVASGEMLQDELNERVANARPYNISFFEKLNAELAIVREPPSEY